MKKIAKKCLVSTLLIFATAGLAACGGKGGEASTSQGGGANTSTSKPASDKCVVTFRLNIGSGDADIYTQKEVKERFCDRSRTRPNKRWLYLQWLVR